MNVSLKLIKVFQKALHESKIFLKLRDIFAKRLVLISIFDESRVAMSHHNGFCRAAAASAAAVAIGHTVDN